MHKLIYISLLFSPVAFATNKLDIKNSSDSTIFLQDVESSGVTMKKDDYTPIIANKII
jgi:hypothetical protein